MGVTPLAWLAAGCGALVAVGVTTVVGGVLDRPVEPVDEVAAPARSNGPGRSLRTALRSETAPAPHRLLGWVVVGVGVWASTGWPVAGVVAAVVGAGSPWLLGSGRVARERIERIEALGTWCRRMADTLVGGGAVGLVQAISTSADHAPGPIAGPVRRLAERVRSGDRDHLVVLTEFADAIDDRTGDAVAAALALALHQQSAGVARVLRQLADGIGRDVRARRDIEAERAEARQSISTLLIIQAVVLGLLALVPGFAAPYRDGAGQLVMAVLLSGTVALLIWMRRLALGRLAPRFLGDVR